MFESLAVASHPLQGRETPGTEWIGGWPQMIHILRCRCYTDRETGQNVEELGTSFLGRVRTGGLE